MQIEIIKNSKKFVGLSLVIVVLSLGAFFIKGLNYGIDFSGGNLFQLRFEKPVTLNDINNNLDEISKEINQVNPNSRKVQISEDNTVIIRTPELTETEKAEAVSYTHLTYNNKNGTGELQSKISFKNTENGTTVTGDKLLFQKDNYMELIGNLVINSEKIVAKSTRGKYNLKDEKVYIPCLLYTSRCV